MEFKFRNTRKKISNHGVLKNSLVLAVTTIVSNIFMYFFYFYTARILGPKDYSIFGALLSIYFIVFFLTNIMNYLVINYIAYFKAKMQFDKIRRLFDILVRIMAVTGFAIFLFVLFLSPKLNEFIKSSSTTPIIFLGLFLWGYIMLATMFGMLGGLQKFFFLGLSRVLDGFLTLLFGIIFLTLGMGISGSMLALFFAALLTIPMAVIPLKSLFNIRPARLGNLGILEYVIKSLIPSMFIAVMLNADVILVKILFDDANAGYFAAASLMGKVVFFISTGVLTVIFPKAAELSSNGEDTSSLLRDGLTYTAVIGFLTSVLYLVFPGFFAHLIFSAEYQIDSLIGIYALSVTFLSLTNVFVMYNMAINKFGVAYIIVPFTVLQLTAISVFHSSLIQVLSIQAGLMFLLFVLLIYFNKEDFIKMFKVSSGYRKYPISAYLRIKTGGNDERTSSDRIKVKEVDDFLPLDDIDFMEGEGNRKN